MRKRPWNPDLPTSCADMDIAYGAPRSLAGLDASRRLNLGCGTDIREGWVNLDRARLPGVDVVHDLSTLPLPFADGEFAEICAKDVLEHLDYIPLLRELHRVLRVGGVLDIQVPHFTSAGNFIDPTHKRLFSIRTFEFFVPGGGLAGTTISISSSRAWASAV